MDESFTQSFNALDWAKAFVKMVKENPSIATDEDTMLGWFANALMRGFDESLRRQCAELAAQSGEKLTPSEAVLGFAAWLTCRDRAVTFGSRHDAGLPCRLVEVFCKANSLADVRATWPTGLIHPNESESTQPGAIA